MSNILGHVVLTLALLFFSCVSRDNIRPRNYPDGACGEARINISFLGRGGGRCDTLVLVLLLLLMLVLVLKDRPSGTKGGGEAAPPPTSPYKPFASSLSSLLKK